MNISITLLICFASLISLGQSFKGAYIQDTRTGCKIWTEYYSKSVSVSWSGNCQNKLATGFGTLIWYDNGKETARYTGTMQKGNPTGKGKYVWSNGYIQEGNYFQGQFLNLDSIYLTRLEKNDLPITDNANIYINDADARGLFYYALAPKGGVKGALVLLSGSSETASNVFTSNVELTQRASDSGLLVIVPSINNNLALGPNELNFLNATFESAVAKYAIPRNKIVMGGFSLGGLYALRYAEMANDSNFKTSVSPLAVFAADPPVDIARLYEIFQREIDRNNSEAAVAECKRYLKSMETDFGGTPSGQPEKYKLFSAFSRTERDGGNLKYLKAIPVRIYSDPDIDWQMKKRNGDYYDMGALDQTTMIVLLNRLGNAEAEFMNALGKGHNLDGTRNPHAWSIIDAGECVDWILKCVD